MSSKYTHRVLSSERGRQKSEGRRCADGSKVWSDAVVGWGAMSKGMYMASRNWKGKETYSPLRASRRK